MPTTGQALPFISAGGSSLLIFLAAMGVLLNISRYTTAATRQLPVVAETRRGADLPVPRRDTRTPSPFTR